MRNLHIEGSRRVYIIAIAAGVTAVAGYGVAAALGRGSQELDNARSKPLQPTPQSNQDPLQKRMPTQHPQNLPRL